jgi:menaquinone-specific isochorismate synthase
MGTADLTVRFHTQTTLIHDVDDLLTALPESAEVAWIRHGEGLVGWGEAARLELPPGPDRFDVAQEWLRDVFDSADGQDEVGLPGSGPVGFGSFTFDPRSPGSVLVVPRMVLGLRRGRAWLTTVAAAAGSATPSRPPAAMPRTGSRAAIAWAPGALTRDGWLRAVESVLAETGAGRLAKVVLSRDVCGTADAPIDMPGLLRELGGRFPECYTFLCANLIGATPELLVRRHADRVESLVLAGSIPRGRHAAEDDAVRAALRTSAKDAAEHRFAVESVRKSLAPFCRDLTAPAEPELLTLANIHHLATPIAGRPDAEISALRLAAALHPSAAVCGVPTDSALELIRELECRDRGRYTGPVGWMDARGDGEWGIALRCAEVDGRRVRVSAGAGIVAGSDPVSELAETDAKMRAMLGALAAGRAGAR